MIVVQIVTNKDVLEWCFVVGALDLSVFGSIFGVYAGARFAAQTVPRIVSVLRWTCRALAFVLTILTLTSIYICLTENIAFLAWVIVGSLALVAVFAIILSALMD
jgi:hypothetical protein